MVWYDDSGHDDSWRDSYDAWKLASPDDDREDSCLHEDFEIGLDGLARCNECLANWWPTVEEEQHFRHLNQQYDEHCRREERRDRWRARWRAVLDFTFPFRWRVNGWLLKRWRTRFPISDYDEIPF